MNLQHLEYIMEIENCGSISKAAKRLFVTQPYLSKILKETEEQYGVTIFTRGKVGIAPTESGRLFLDMARDLLDNANNFARVFEEQANSYRLRISACTSSHPTDGLIRMITSIPDIPLRFTLRESTNNEVIDDVYSNRSDVGVLLYPVHLCENIMELLRLRHLEKHDLFHSSTQLFCRVGHPILKELDNLTPEKISQYNFVLYSNEISRTHALESIYSDSALRMINWNHIKQVIRVGSRSTLHNIILRTDFLGISISSILDQEKNYQIVSFELPEALLPKDGKPDGYTMSYIYPKGRELSKAARVYITFLEQYYGSQSNYAETTPGASPAWKK